MKPKKVTKPKKMTKSTPITKQKPIKVKIVMPSYAPVKPLVRVSNEIRTSPDVQIQDHIRRALQKGEHTATRTSVYDLSENKITKNPLMKRQARPARYNSTQGLPGPAANYDAPIVRDAPRAVMDYRQLMVNAPNNEVPDEYGVTNQHRFPMQNIIPTSGGKMSGRTGPIR